MSGGHFDYEQYRIKNQVEMVDQLIKEHGSSYREDTLAEFEYAKLVLATSAIYLHRIDWLVSGDDGEDTFHQRLHEDLVGLGD
jgi:hypothetical protein